MIAFIESTQNISDYCVNVKQKMPKRVSSGLFSQIMYSCKFWSKLKKTGNKKIDPVPFF